MTLSAITNFYREKHAMPGWLEMATSGFFDEVVCVSSPPSDAPPDEETIEIVKKAGVRLVHTVIDQGYGVVRTRCIRECKTDWVMIMDCDERFHVELPELTCHGTEVYPAVKEPNLSVTRGPTYNQGALLKEMIEHAGSADCIRMSRRHWFGAPGTFDRPQQNWSREPDWQLRCVRNSQWLFYDPEVKMHERILNSRTWHEPSWGSGDQSLGPFFDHYSGYYKAMEPEQNAEDARIYEALDPGCVSKMWLGHAPGVKDL